MTAPKRILTTVSEIPSPRGNKRLRHARREIAAEAARIMATQSQNNFRIAKQKAAQRLGINYRQAMPSNVEIETALRAYQDFYGGQQHINQIQRFREIALRVMRSLESFCPRLVGPVLEGTADKHARVSLHIFNDPPDAVVMHLLDKGLEFFNEQRKIRWHDGSYRMVPLIITNTEEVTIELSLFHSVDLRQAPPSPVDGRPQKRARVYEVECLLAGA